MIKKKEIVPISSMKDLMDLVNHNCEVFDRRTRKLSKGSRNLKILCVIAIGYAVYATIESKKQEECKW